MASERKRIAKLRYAYFDEQFDLLSIHDNVIYHSRTGLFMAATIFSLIVETLGQSTGLKSYGISVECSNKAINSITGSR